MLLSVKQTLKLFLVVFFVGQLGNAIGQCTLDSVSYPYTGDTATFKVPACVTSITIKAWGAGGGGGGIDCDAGAVGGGGAYSSGIISVSPSQTYSIVIGGGGGPGANNAVGIGGGFPGLGYGNGGVGGNPGYQHPGGVSGAGGGGGGGTAFLNGLTPLVVAGGGGGGGGAGCEYQGGGGGGGGQNGFAGIGAGGAAGGSLNDNGVGGSNGTWDCGGGGGGGGGILGGDSGKVSACDCGGGGGGGGNSLGGTIVNGSGATPGYNIYPGLPAGDALGGPGDVDIGGQPGGNGYMIIEYCAYADYTDSVSSKGVTCYGMSNGSATVSTDGGSSPLTYLWLPSGGTNATATGLSAGIYTVQVTDSGGCKAAPVITITQPPPVKVKASSIPPDSACAGESIMLIATGAETYKWSTGSTDSTITVVIPAGDTAYYGLKGMIGPCKDSIPVKIKVIPKITASFTATKDTICPGDPVTIAATATGGQSRYNWSTGDTTSSITVFDTVTTIYTASVYGLCDSITKTMTVTVIPLPKPVISGPMWRCSGVADTLSVSSATNPSTYVWSNGATATTIITGGIRGDSTLYVTAYNSLGCPVTDTFKIAQKIPPFVTVNPNTVDCSGSPILLKANAKGTGPFTYQWSPGGQTNDTITVNPDSTTAYTVLVSNGCVVTEKTIITPDNPALSACCNKTILVGDDTILVAHGSGTQPYQWSPSVNCLTPLCDSVQVTPTVTTTYTVVMVDSSGCRLESVVTIVVEIRCFDFNVPNVFTPDNGGLTGLDKIFYIKTENLDAYSLDIYDRWGKEVYQSTNPDAYWDGTANGGGQAPAGVYYYVIKATCQNNEYKKDGFVQLIR